MSRFALDWLDLRKDADDRARNRSLAHAAASGAELHGPPLIVDLGTGAGANVAVLKSYLTSHADWRLVDDDAALLSVAAERCGASGIECCIFDLARDGALPVNGARLVTASALLDLVSEAWIERLVQDVTTSGADFYAALTADGSVEWSPVHPTDEDVLRAFNIHHRGDKGFGRALGGGATSYARRCFEAAGYHVRVETSPWQLGRRDERLIRALVDGMASAVSETGIVDPGMLTKWRDFRLGRADMGTCRIGHHDLFAMRIS